MNKDRRKFLKILLIGGGTLIVGKIFGPLFSKYAEAADDKEAPHDFRIDEDGKSLSVYDDSGEEVLHIDKKD